MSGFTDHQAAARAGVDQSARQSGYPLFPRGWDAMDPGRFDVPCSDDMHVQQMIGSVNRWRARCDDCGKVRHGWSKAEAIANLKAAHGG